MSHRTLSRFFGRALPAAALLISSEALPDDISSLRGAFEAARQSFRETSNGGHCVQNPGQGWTIRFDGRGFATNSSWGLQLKSIGIDGAATMPLPDSATSISEDNRLVYRWSDDVREWFVNDRRGLQQGWTIVRRPQGVSSAPLNVDLAVKGPYTASIDTSAETAYFASSGNGASIAYGGLLAWDAHGQRLESRFVKIPDGIRIVINDRSAIYPITIDPVAQNAYVKASNTDADDYFGFSVAISGDTAVVGAIREDSTATGVNGNQASNVLNNAGAAYVFVRQNGAWSQQAYLKASNTDDLDNFGHSAAIDGDTIVVGAPAEDSNSTGVDGPSNNLANGSGAAYVFVRVGGIWSHQAYLKASNTGTGDRFGESVAVSGDTIVVGAPWEDSNATGINGADNNTFNEAGAAYVFIRVGGVWSQQAYLKASNTGADDEFGAAVAVDGNRAVVGAPQEDATAMDSGRIYIYERAGGIWSFDTALKASNPGAGDEFGTSVSISGETIVAGAPNEDSSSGGVNGAQNDGAGNSGAAYVFVHNGVSWVQQAYMKPLLSSVGNEFGGAVDISGDFIIVGADFEDSDSTGVNGSPENLGATSSGAAFVFQRANGATWFQDAYLKASNTQTSDRFGGSVSIDGGLAIVGARFEDSDATGINGNQASNAEQSSGAAYIFVVTPAEFTKPNLAVKGGKTIRIRGKRVVIRGTAKDASGIALVEFKAGKGGFKRASFKGKTWKAVVRLKGTKRKVVAKIRAIDAQGNISKLARVKVIRRR